MNILVAHNPVAATMCPDDADVLAQVRAVTTVLADLGHVVQILEWPHSSHLARSLLAAQRPDLVFNLVESVQGAARYAHLVPALLADMEIPWTGGSAWSLEQSTNKLFAKSVLQVQGLPAPRWLDAQGSGPACFPGVFIVKSVWEHASHGLDGDNVLAAGNAGELLGAILQREEQWGGEWFAEAYLPGREFSLAVIEEAGLPRLLSPAEMVFTDYPADMPQVVGYRAKWLEQSFEYQNTVRRQEFPDQDKALLDRLRTLTQDCWRAFRLSGYARVDFRVDADDQPWIIDVNANPCLSPDAGFQAAAAASGLRFTGIVERLLRAASRQSHALHGSRDAAAHPLNCEWHHGTDQLSA